MEQLAISIETEYDSYDDAFQDYIEQLDEDYNTKITIMDENMNIIMTTKVLEDKKNKVGENTARLFKENLDKMNKGKSAVLYKKNNNNKKEIRIILIRKIDTNRYVALTRSFQSLKNATYAAIWFDVIFGV